jgi:hypothetical protein
MRAMMEPVIVVYLVDGNRKQMQNWYCLFVKAIGANTVLAKLTPPEASDVWGIRVHVVEQAVKVQSHPLVMLVLILEFTIWRAEGIMSA